MKKINIGLVGCGRVGDYYFDILKSNKIKNFELVAVCDENLEKTKKFKNKFKCKISKSYMDPKFYENLDAVLILTPSGSHFAIVKFFLQKKINVISEKPLTMLPKNSLILDKLAKKNKVMCTVVFQNRFNKSIRYLKSLIEKKKLVK